MNIGMHIILRVNAVWLKTQIHERLGSYHTLTCTLHVYKPTVQPVASRGLFLDIQALTLLLEQFTLLICVNLYYPTSRLHSYFSTIFVAH